MLLPSSDTHFSFDLKKYQRAVYDAALAVTPGRSLAVDIGAHVGIFTVRMEDDFDETHSFEPDNANFQCLKGNARRSHLHNIALYNTAGRGVLRNPKPSNSGAWEFSLGGDVEARTLDSFNLQPDLIKIDVQGCEGEVLAGAKKTLTAHRPTLIVEMNDDIDIPGYEMVEKIRKDGVWTCILKS